MKHVMIDLETLGTKVNAVVLSIGACEFDENGVGKEFYVEISLEDSLRYDLKVEKGSLDFWLGSAGVKPPIDGSSTLKNALESFHGWYDDCSLLWACGTDFDIGKLEYCYDLVGIKYPWGYGNKRDFRTIRDTIGDETYWRHEKGDHNALKDAISQAKYLVNLNEDYGLL